MKVLIPLVSKMENDAEFLEQAITKAKEIILLLVIDTTAMKGEFGFAASEIMQGNNLMEETKHTIGLKRKTAKAITEWGPTVQKISNIARLQQVNKIAIKKSSVSRKLAHQLTEELKKEKIKIEVL